MNVTRQNLVDHFQLLSDEELLAQFRSGGLTDLAKDVAGLELRGRNIGLPEPVTEEPAEPDAAVLTGDLVLVARYATAAEAYMLRSRLELEGMPAVVTDAQMSQTIVPLLVGGVRVLVPETYLQRAQEIAVAAERGDYALDDKTDVG
jgi:hypothetical protein